MTDVPVERLVLDTRQGRLVLAATITASGVAFLDSSVVVVALPAIGRDLGGGFATLQWVVDAYLLTLGSLVLVGGALGDRFGLRRVFHVGLVGFALASLLCGLAPSAGTLVAARAVQGATAALLTPASLALLSSSFVDADRGRAIGAWSGLSGVFTALGPFAGGLMVDAAPSGWRWVFLINLPLVAIALVLSRAAVPDVRPTPTARPDLLGAVLVTAGLALLVRPLIEWNRLPRQRALAELAAAVVLLAAFLAVEARRGRAGRTAPMLPLGLFRIRTFAAGNVVTLLVYAALTVQLFLLTVTLQQALGWSALAAGAAGLPVTLVLLLLSARVGGLVPTVGPRLLLTAGGLLLALGCALLTAVGPGTTGWSGYLRDVLPGLTVFALGLVLIVAPVTTTVLGDVGADRSGVASGVNNAVARVAGLLAVAVVPLVAGFGSGAGASGPTSPAQAAEQLAAFDRATLVSAALCLLGGLLAWLTLPPRRPLRGAQDTPDVAPSGA